MSGGRIDIEVGADVSRFPADMEKGLKGAVGTAGKLGGMLGAAIGVSMGTQAVVDLGNSFTNSLNEMQAVSQATAEQMNAVRDAAKGLGNDASIADTSAVDAAAAMTELAKGGFSVEQSMNAAKGTLQLAAAAQIDAATAATIQSQALQAFGLDADYAAKAADVLANGANASSAEITDVASGLQQAGAVANQFGVSLEDTVAGLGMLANAGIQGSDAGTLLKSAMLALTDQSNPAQGAIEDLGLTVYNAAGEFVGFRELFGQLQAASSSMTPEMYQAATATLFGSDAMRLAGVAAEQGTAGWDTMREAIEREGAAAEVAAAKTQGLPGALSAIENSAEGVMLTLYDLVDGPLEKLANMGADALGDFGTKLESSFGTATSAVSAFADSDMGQDKLGELTTLVDTITGAAADAAPAIGQVGASVAEVAAYIAGGGLTVLLDVLNGAAEVAGDVLVPALEVLGGALEGNEEAIATFAGGFLAFQGISEVVEGVAGPFDEIREKADSAREFVGHFASATSATADTARYGTVQMGRFGSSIQQIGNRVPAVANMQTAFLNAATGADRFGRSAGTAAAAAVGMKTAASGVVSALGGPMGVALAGAGIAMAVYGQHQADIAERNRKLTDSAQELAEALAASNGAVTEASRTAAAAALENNKLAGSERSLLEYLEAIGVSGQQAAAGLAGSRDAMESTLAIMEEQARLEEELNSQRLSGEGFESTALGQLLNWDGAGDKANEARNAADAYREVVDQTNRLIEAEKRRREASGELDNSGTTTELGTMADTMREFADSTGTAADKVDILNGGLADLRGDAMSMEDATKRVNDALRGFGEALGAAGTGAITSTGQIDTTTAAGSRLYDTVKNVQSGYDSVISAAYQAELQQSGSYEAAAQAAIDAGNAQREQFIATAIEVGATRAEAESLANTYRLTPDSLITMVQLTGDKEAAAALEALVEKERIARIKIAVDTYGAGSAQAFVAATNGMSEAEFRQRFPQYRADGGRLPARADGGRLPTTGPGTDRTDGIYGVDASGTPIARVDAGEWVINRTSSQKYDGLLDAINRDDPRLSTLPAFASGGPIVMSMVNAVQQKFPGMQFTSGERYTDNGYHSKNMAADFSDGYDSTPTMRALAAWIADNYADVTLQLIHQPFDRNIGQGVGFVGDGLGFYGAGTMSEHRNHVHWAVSEEVGEPRASTGASTDGSSSSERRRREVETWDEEDELDLDSARIAVLQAIEARDEANASDKKSEADRMQAQNKVDQAQLKVQKLEEKKHAAETGGGFIPDAPELTTNYTDDELRLRDLERAKDEAKWDRDEVYDDPESTQHDRDEADDKYQRAINALRDEQQEQFAALAPEAPALQGRMTDEQMDLADLEDAVEEARLERNAVYADPKSTDREKAKADRDYQRALNARDDAKTGKSDSGSGSGLKSLGAIGLELGEAFAGGVLETFGLEDSPIGFLPKLLFGTGDIGGPLLKGIGTTGIPAMIAQQQSAPLVSSRDGDADIAKPGPAREEWIEELMNSLKVPAVLRDAGGPVPHGVAALNLSGETEWVQTAEDKRRYDRDMRELAALRADATGAPAAAMAGEVRQLAQGVQALAKQPRRNTTINAHGMDPAKVGRLLERELRRDTIAQMSTGGLRG